MELGRLIPESVSGTEVEDSDLDLLIGHLEAELPGGDINLDKQGCWSQEHLLRVPAVSATDHHNSWGWEHQP